MLLAGRPAALAAAVVLAVGGAVVSGFALYQLSLAVAALFYRDSRDVVDEFPAPQTRVAVIVPAHDEELVIERCIRSLQTQSYPRGRYEIVVIADNCSDDTASAAQRAGAQVL